MRFHRCKLLFGDDFCKIQNARVIILGVGGVGGFCLDCLYRTGVGSITIVDFDAFDETNQNRQIGSEHLECIKVEALAKMYEGVVPICAKIDAEWVETFDFSEFDLIIDCIDDIKAKVAVAIKCHFKLISSLGAAKRSDPTKIGFAKISSVKNDPFAAKFRQGLKKAGFAHSFDVIYSEEPPKDIKEKGSFVAVTGAFGLSICSLAVKKILGHL